MALSVTEVKVRTAIRMGGEDGFYLETPYVKSFNVKRARGQLSATFSASLKVKHLQLNANKASMVGNMFEIWAGTINEAQAAQQELYLPNVFLPVGNGGTRYLLEQSSSSSSFRKIFTGYVLKISFNPCRDDAEFIYLNVSGNDVFYYLQNKKFTRRAKASSMEMWGAITSVVRSRANFDTKFPEKLDETKVNLDPDSPYFVGKEIIKTRPLSAPRVDFGGDAGPLSGRTK